MSRKEPGSVEFKAASVLCDLAAACAANAQVVTYPAPEGMGPAPGWNVSADGKQVFVYQTITHDGPGQMASFDFSGTVTVSVTGDDPIESAEVRPRSFGIVPQFRDKTVTFTLSQPRQVVVELNGDRRNVLHLFANAPETDVPNSDDGNVTCFGPGVHDAGEIVLKSGQSIYLAGGAYVYGQVVANHVENIKLFGRGILCGNKTSRGNLVRVAGSSGVEIRGVTMVDKPRPWVCLLNGANQVLLDNVKIINSYGGGSDGIDICGCKDVTISNCFVRDVDDNICIKGGFDTGGDGNVQRIRIVDCVLWSDGCRTLQIGIETRCDKIEDVLYKNIDIIHHDDGSHPVLSISPGDHSTVSNIRYEDIRIEDAHGAALVDLCPSRSHYTRDDHPGRIRDVHFKNVDLIGGAPPRIVKSWAPWADNRLLGIYGEDDRHDVRGVTFENMHVHGKLVASPREANIQVREFAHDLRFTGPADGSPAASFEVAPAPAAGAGRPTRFFASAVAAEGARIVSWDWSLGDGEKATGPSVEHAYGTPGNYWVELTVRDDAGRVGRAFTCVPALALHGASKTPPYRPAIEIHEPPWAGEALVAGVDYACYAGKFQLRKLDEFAGLKPFKTGAAADFDPSVSDTMEDHAICFSGYLDVPDDGIYTFFLNCKVNGRLFIDDQTVAQANWVIESSGDSGQIALKKGRHPIRLWLDNRSKMRRLELDWSGPGFTNQRVPEALLLRVRKG